jgi:endonuclease VIII
MPEGDTIFRMARSLARALEGREVTDFRTVLAHLARVDDDAPIVGRRVERVRSMGKNLIITLSGGLHLRAHMRMHGSWHLYEPSSPWRKPQAAMRVLIGTEAWVAVAFDVPVAEFLTDAQLKRHPDLSRIGPDLLDPAFDEDEALCRLRARTGTIAEALLNQRVVAGVGNEYKSEVLFLARINPVDPVSVLKDDALREIIAIARRLLRENVVDPAREPLVVRRGSRRTTRMLNEAERRWVYGRSGKPCRTCGAVVQVTKIGIDARLTFWCPECQPRRAELSKGRTA